MRLLIDNALSPALAERLRLEADLATGSVVVIEPARIRIRALPLL